MDFKDLQNIKQVYNSLSDEIITDFYIPCLERAVVYKRAVGYFSSNILLQISKGLGAFADHHGKMKLLVSPKLEKEDYEAIKKGYDAREYITDKLVKTFDFNIDFQQRNERFKMLAYMIQSGLLEIKIVVLLENNNAAMFHRKVGIMEDENGNHISFSGSGNETYNGYNLNDEEFDVFCSWLSDDSDMRCSAKEMSFDNVWDNRSKGLISIPFPEVIKNHLITYCEDNSLEQYSFADVDIKLKEYILSLKNAEKTPCVPKSIHFYDYQKQAIENWKNSNFNGIFDMATGTGKTFTAIGAICSLFNEKKKLITFICCPYIHLVDQWCEELLAFNIDPIKCYGNLNYEKKLKRALVKFKQERQKFVCVVITNSSFIKEQIQELVTLNLNDTLLVVDEAHNFGANEISKTMEIQFPYRLALSATLDRYGDEIGTKKLYDFFGEKSISYPLSRAIEEGKLTPYKYYPVIVSLNEDEYDEYISLSKKIVKYHTDDGTLSDQAKRLLIKRARLVAGAQNKLVAFENIIQKYKDKSNILVYCGAVKYGQFGYEEATEEKKQIEKVLNILNIKLNIVSTKFTAEENTEQRHSILNAFKDNDVQALVAIKCLDEGMNIPAIKTAFILASSTNPKEYIQRRGRVLRKSSNKEFAEIYDFITLPVPLEKNRFFKSANYSIECNLVKKELIRLLDFAGLSMNSSYSNDIIVKIKEKYDMYTINEEEDELYE